MQAAVFTGTRRPLELETLEIEEPRAGEVRVRMLASGVCHSDLHVIEGEWPEDPPIVLGHEGFGEVEAVGDGVASPAVGDRVVLSWYAPCGGCDRCLEGRPWICQRSSSDDHLMRDGTARLRRSGGEAVRSYLAVGSFGERAVVSAAAAVPVPRELPADVGALIGCGVTTGVGAVVNTARVEPGASAVVIGCGGVGLSVVLGLALAGADPIVAVDLHDEKLDMARDVGATHAVRAGDGADAQVAAIIPGGSDHVFEAIGLVSTIEWGLSIMPKGGTMTLVGMTPSGDLVRIDPLDFSASGKTLLGCTYGSSRPGSDFPRLARLHLAGRLPIDRMITGRIGLDGLNDAFDQMRRGEGARSVIVY
jgi:S-(hydroxymethyl)glutathione dehydrogenase / alcohol dehydrogenase